MQFLAFSVENLLRGLWASLCQLVYRLLAWLYELFLNVSRVQLLTTDDIKPIYQRITMILTIVMVFYVTFEAVKYVVTPDTFTDKEKGGGNLALKMVLVVILIAFVPSIFTYAYKFQNVIFDNQVFSKVILGKQQIETEKFGRTFSANVLGMFYYADEATWDSDALEKEDNCEDIPCKTVVSANISSLIEYGEIPMLQVGLEDGDEIDTGGNGDVFQYYIHFDGLLAVLVGGFVCYMLILYCVDVGVRVVQLGFLQIIAPIPIIGYLSPKKDGVFQKWVKQCVTTYLDLFIRTAIIYFGLLICQILSEAYTSETLFNNIPGDLTTTMKVFIYIALILGVLMFMRKAPKLLGELFPNSGAASGNFGLSLKERPEIARAVGGTVVPALTGAKGLIGGTINKAKRDWKNLRSGKHKEDLKAYGKTAGDVWKARAERLKKGWSLGKNWKSMSKEERSAAWAEYKKKNESVKDSKLAHKSAKSELQNSALGIAPLSGVASGIGGIVRGVNAGVQATSLSGIYKQAKAGLKSEGEALQKTEKWYAEGGGSSFDRAITSIEQSLGIATQSDMIDGQIKQYDEQIKENESVVQIAGSSKKDLDEAESLISGKLDKDSKLELDDTAVSYLSGKVPGVEAHAGQTYKDLLHTYKSKVDVASANLEATSQNGGDVEAARAALQRARDEETLIKKHAARAAITYTLQHPEDPNLFAPATQKLESAKEDIRIANRDSRTTAAFIASLNADMRKEINAVPETAPDRESQIATIKARYQAQEAMFRNIGSATDFDAIDDINTRLQTVISNVNLQNQQLRESKRQLETSSHRAAAKADVNASSGK